MSDNPPSPIMTNYNNELNSEGISQGFICSTPINSINYTKINNKRFYITGNKENDKESKIPKVKITSDERVSFPLSQELFSQSSLMQEDITENASIYQQLQVPNSTVENVFYEILKEERIQTSLLKNMTEQLANIGEALQTQVSEESNASKLATNKILRETQINTKNILKNFSQVFGRDDSALSVEIEILCPAKTMAELSDLESRVVSDKKFNENMVACLRKIQGLSESLELGFRFLAKDEVYIEFNFDGKCGKRSLNNLKLFNQVIFDSYHFSFGREQFEKEIKKCVQHSHNRFHQNCKNKK